MKTIFLILFIILFNFEFFSQPLFLEQPSGTTKPLNYVFQTNWQGLNAVAAWICGDSGVVLKNSNPGGSFTNVSIPLNMNLNTIASSFDNSISALTAGVKNDTAIVYRTTNGGTNWTVAFRQYQGSIN